MPGGSSRTEPEEKVRLDPSGYMKSLGRTTSRGEGSAGPRGAPAGGKPAVALVAWQGVKESNHSDGKDRGMESCWGRFEGLICCSDAPS